MLSNPGKFDELNLRTQKKLIYFHIFYPWYFVSPSYYNSWLYGLSFYFSLLLLFCKYYYSFLLSIFIVCTKNQAFSTKQNSQSSECFKKVEIWCIMWSDLFILPQHHVLLKLLQHWHPAKIYKNVKIKQVQACFQLNRYISCPL